MERHRSQEKLVSEWAVANVPPSAGSIPVLTAKINNMKNENVKAIVGLILAIVLVFVIGCILKLTNNI